MDEVSTVAADRPARVAGFLGRACRAFLFLGVGLFAGLVAFVGIAWFGNSFRMPQEIVRIVSQESLTREEGMLVAAAERKLAYQNTALSVAILGGVAGGVLGLAAGLRRHAALASAGGFLGGAVFGSLFGAVGGLVELYAADWMWSRDFTRWPAHMEQPFKTMAAHSAAFLILGTGVGLAAGLASRTLRHSLGVVLAAGLIAGLVYPGVAAAVFPISNTDAVVPYPDGPRLMWTLLPLALMGLALGRTEVVPRRTPRL